MTQEDLEMKEALPPGILKQRPEDFLVEELPAYAPTGEGTHVFIRFTKTDLTTTDAGRAMARALGCDPRAAGFAGMKDKRAITTQTISLETPRGVASSELAERACALDLPGITVHEATPHGHKIKAGHLAGNRFTLLVRQVPRDRLDQVEDSLRRVAERGVPNAFGGQRFGRAGDNAARALAWLGGKERGPRDPRMQRFLWSSLQSKVFNAVLEARVDDGTWTTPLVGDLLKLRTSGGLFLCSDVQTDGQRAAAGELCPTGPLVGSRMRSPEGAPDALERRITAAILGEDFDLDRTRRLGPGTRRPLRLWVQDLRWERILDDPGHRAACMRVYFVLPKGAYATTVMSGVFATDVPPDDGEPREDEGGSEDG